MALDFSRNYSPPGVYIEETDSTLVSLVGVPPTIVALVGPARGYQINTERFVLGDDPITLAKQGIDATSVKVTNAATSVVLDAAEYEVVKVGTSDEQDYESTIAATVDIVVADAVVFVTYQYTDPTYFTPRTFRNFEDVKDVFGEPLNTSFPVAGETYVPVVSPLSLAAMLAIQNGATDLVLCAATPPGVAAVTDAAKSTARAAALKAAYLKIESNPAVNVVVPVTTGILEADAGTVITDLLGHITTGFQEGLFRFGVWGFDPAVTTAPDLLVSSNLTGQTTSDRRLMEAYAAPGGMNMYSGPSNSSFAVGHSFLAAGYAGRMQALPIQQSLTKQAIVGFSGIAGTPLPNSLKNQYSSAGVAVVEQDRFNRLTVRHGVTCDPSNINTREASVVRARDGLVRSLAESTANSGLIGSPLDEDLLLSVKSNVQGVLESAMSDEVILAYSGLTLRQTAADPSVIEVKFAYKPAYPLNYIVISFSIDMSTGTTNLATDDSTSV